MICKIEQPQLMLLEMQGGMKLYLSEEVAEARYHVIGAEMQVVNLSLNTGESESFVKKDNGRYRLTCGVVAL